MNFFFSQLTFFFFNISETCVTFMMHLAALTLLMYHLFCVSSNCAVIERGWQVPAQGDRKLSVPHVQLSLSLRQLLWSTKGNPQGRDDLFHLQHLWVEFIFQCVAPECLFTVLTWLPGGWSFIKAVEKAAPILKHAPLSVDRHLKLEDAWTRYLRNAPLQKTADYSYNSKP